MLPSSELDVIWVAQPAERTRASVSTEYYWGKPHNTSEPPDRCPECGRRQGMLRWEPPFNVECWAQKSGFSDFAMKSYYNLIVNERAFVVLTNANVTGLVTRGFISIQSGRPRAVLGADRERRRLLDVQMSPIMVDERASEYIRACPIECLRCSHDGLCGYERVEFVRPFTHAPPDLFWSLNGGGFLCCTDRFRRLVLENGLTGLRFIRSTEYSRRDPLDVQITMEHDGVVYMKDLDDPGEYLRKSRAWIARVGRREE